MVRPRYRHGEIVRVKCLLGCPPKPPNSSVWIPSQPEVLSGRHCVGMSCLLEPLRGKPVPEHPVALREHRVHRPGEQEYDRTRTLHPAPYAVH